LTSTDRDLIPQRKGRQMAENAEALVRKTKKLGILGFGAVAVTGAFLAFGAGTAGADVSDVEGDPSAPFANPVAEDGIRPSEAGLVNAGVPCPPSPVASGAMSTSVRSAVPVRRSGTGNPSL
jgi:hypothetical protein